MAQLNGKAQPPWECVPLNVDGMKQVAVMERSDMTQRLLSSFDWRLSSLLGWHHMPRAIFKPFKCMEKTSRFVAIFWTAYGSENSASESKILLIKLTVFFNRLIKICFSPRMRLSIFMHLFRTACFEGAVLIPKCLEMTKRSFSPFCLSITPFILTVPFYILPGPDHGDDDRVLPLYLHHSGNVPCLLMQIVSFVLIFSPLVFLMNSG